jgi:hypothetical protein
VTDPSEPTPRTPGWQPIHTIGTVVTLVAVGVIAGSWYVALLTRGAIVRWEIVGGGPVLLAHGLSMLVAPRGWSGPDGNDFRHHAPTELLTLAVGFLLGGLNILALKLVLGL